MCQVSWLSMEKAGECFEHIEPPTKAFYMSEPALPTSSLASYIAFTAPPGEGSTGCLVLFLVRVANTTLCSMIALFKDAFPK